MAEDPEDLSNLVRQLNSSVRKRPHPSPPSGAGDGTALAAPQKLESLLKEAVASGASDLLLVAGVAPALRLNGSLIAIGEEALTAEETRSFSYVLLDEVRYREFLRDKATDFIYERSGLGRFRCDLHHQRGTVAAAMRVLPARIPTIEELSLPASYGRFTSLAHGLVLFCGPTGCGKSTTMAALIDSINRTRSAHIVTIEDPLEYVHTHERSVVEHVEIGRDSGSFASALRHALRQNPDVVLVGEMLDLETISIALTAAETGHVVFSTLHTPDASQTIDRIVDVFPESQQNQIRQQISLSLAGIAVQTLVPTSDGRGRVPACEVLLANDAIRNLIRTGKNHLIYSQITMGRKEGMTTMEESLASLVKRGAVTVEDAALRTGRREEFQKLLG